MSTTRRGSLVRIMQIEDQIRRLNQDAKYKLIKENLDALTDSGAMGNIRVNDPKNMNNLIMVRRSSDAMKDLVSEYRSMLSVYEARIGKLQKEKEKLHVSLFG